jgi:bifunctional oligoribonuclease and PAP phosphatase NrnA
MTDYSQTDQIREIIDGAQRIVIMQADNPDGDSLGSALALEHILGDLGKEPYLYCGVDIPSYLTYLPGWDRIEKELPNQFDASIIVDTSAISLFESLTNNQHAKLGSRPCIVLDHHAVEATIPFATVVCNQPVVSTGELIYELAAQLGWPLNLEAKRMLATSIMADSLGLVTEATSARSIHIIANLVEGGVKLSELEHARRLLMRKSPELVRYKGELLQRIEYHAASRIATVIIPWAEIEQYSPLYNPSMLVMEDMRMTIGTQIGIAFKIYKDGKITAKIRCNQDAPIAAQLAEHFGGGGHLYASGFKLQEARHIGDVKAECINLATKLLDNLPKQ